MLDKLILFLEQVNILTENVPKKYYKLARMTTLPISIVGIVAAIISIYSVRIIT